MSSRKATENFCFVHTTQYIYEEDKKSALEPLVRQATFKFRALWSVRDGKELNNSNSNPGSGFSSFCDKISIVFSLPTSSSFNPFSSSVWSLSQFSPHIHFGTSVWFAYTDVSVRWIYPSLLYQKSASISGTLLFPTTYLNHQLYMCVNCRYQHSVSKLPCCQLFF